MWWRKEDPLNSSGESAPTKRSKVASLRLPTPGRSAHLRKHLIGRTPQPAAPEDPMVHVSETGSGIEVSFSDDLISSPEHIADDPTSPSHVITHGSAAAVSQPTQRSNSQRPAPSPRATRLEEGVVSLQALLWRCQAMHRAQFRLTTAAPETPSITSVIAQAPSTGPADGPMASDMPLRQHRIGLFGREARSPTDTHFDSVLFLLRSHDMVDEISCVEEELRQLSQEMEELERDRADLEARSKSTAQGPPLDDTAPQQGTTTLTETRLAWPDWHRSLAKSLTHAQRTQLQTQRGLYLTVGLHQATARDTFLAKCGATQSALRQVRRLPPHQSRVVEVGPDDCRDGGAAATLQHVALLKASSADAASFLISRDKGKAYCWGLLPEKLFRRIKNAGYDPKHHASDILYLATGPLDSYYAEFRNGECWWGTTSEDEHFHAICSDPTWDICRVAFGPCSTFYDASGEKRFVTSWIILGRDGRAAWRNLPARLHSMLENRLANAPACCEVALGCGGSYFVRFLDGTVDYCLPSPMAKACQSIEKRGASIMAVWLHPELPHDFVIRSDR